MKHPAWKPENGFPQPEKQENGEYLNTFEGIIDYLCIYIIRTSYKKYYASFVNTEHMPSVWPNNIGLESMFQENRKGILKFSDGSVSFINDKLTPFKQVKNEIEYSTVKLKK